MTTEKTNKQRQFFKLTQTLAIAGVGVAVFFVFNLPLPFLLGTMFACLIAALFGLRLQNAGRFSIFMRTILGVAIGTSITPALIQLLPSMVKTLSLIPVLVLVIGMVGYPLLRFGFGFNPPTAYYAAMPGGLQDMLIFGEEAGGDVRALSLIHATRMLVIVSIAPMLTTSIWEVDLRALPGLPITTLSFTQIGLILLAGFLGWQIAERLGLFGASILGPMILATILSLLGVLEQRPPAEFIFGAQLFIGIDVGVKYVGINLKELRHDLLAGLIYSFVLAGISLVFFLWIQKLNLAPSLESFLSFLPGGQAEMVVLTLIAGADLGFVVTHHLLRITLVILCAPLFVQFFKILGKNSNN